MLIEKHVTVRRSPEDLYAFWRSFHNMPLILDYVESVDMHEDRLHWKAKGPARVGVEWDAEIVEDRPGQLLAWRSVEGAAFENAGAVSFTPAPAEWGTEVTLSVTFNPPAGVVGDAVTRLLGVEPGKIAEKALHQFKALMETGEIPTLAHQPAGRNDGRDKDEE
jgi:uncharacterized membrane protein